jgi:hypothetical protein
MAVQYKRTFIPPSHRPQVPGARLSNDESVAVSLMGTVPCISQDALVIIAARDDVISDAFLHQIEPDTTALYRLHYDELATTWGFSFYQGVLKIFTQDFSLIPRAIYHRHPGIPKDHRQSEIHLAFFDVLDAWKGTVVGQKREHYHNASKMYQIITTIRAAKDKVTHAVPAIKVARSFFVKGDFNRLKRSFDKPLVVKSCSSRRSKVASEDEFKQWNSTFIKYLPTLFQEQLEGKDVRVHVCGDFLWPLLIEGKDAIDYRYATKQYIIYKETFLEESVKKFCASLAHIERNILIGIDFIVSQTGYYCLESNPGPGWSMFNHPSKQRFAQVVLEVLKKHT